MRLCLITVLFIFCSISSPQAKSDLIIINATVIPAPNAPAREGISVWIQDARIQKLTATNNSTVPPGYDVIDAGGRVLTSGFWNSHVHFTDPDLRNNASQIIQNMLTSRGFTSVVDLGSGQFGAAAIRKAIDAGQLTGPSIVIADGSLVYKDGTPSYLPGMKFPEVHSPSQAASLVNSVLAMGADGIKIYSGSFQTPTETIWIPVDIVKAITDAAHEKSAFVVSHPTDQTGLHNALYGGVDILAHTVPAVGKLDKTLIQAMISSKIALIPTLKLWRWESSRFGSPESAAKAFQQVAVDQLRDFVSRGGEVLFGTDVGYMQDYDATEEFLLMAQAGMDFDEILTSLTTNPSRRFGRDGATGIVESGQPADLVLFQSDPRVNTSSFTDIALTIKNGSVIFDSNEM